MIVNGRYDQNIYIERVGQNIYMVRTYIESWSEHVYRVGQNINVELVRTCIWSEHICMYICV